MSEEDKCIRCGNKLEYDSIDANPDLVRYCNFCHEYEDDIEIIMAQEQRKSYFEQKRLLKNE